MKYFTKYLNVNEIHIDINGFANEDFEFHFICSLLNDKKYIFHINEFNFDIFATIKLEFYLSIFNVL